MDGIRPVQFGPRERQLVPGLSNVQYQELLSSVSKLKGPTSSHNRLLGMEILFGGINWILDTWASKHTTGNWKMHLQEDRTLSYLWWLLFILTSSRYEGRLTWG